jgi:hypothetical protein
VIAIIVNPQKVAAYRQRTAPEPEPTPPPEHGAPAVPTAPAEAPVVKEPTQRIVFATVSTFASADIATVPPVGVGAGVALGVAVKRLRVELVGSAEPFRSFHPAGAASDVSLRVRVARAGARACFALLDSVVEIAPCAGGEGVSMIARGYGITKPGEDNDLWAEVVVGARAEWRAFANFSLVLEGAAQVPLYHQEILIRPLGTVYVVPGLTGRMAAGVRVVF